MPTLPPDELELLSAEDGRLPEDLPPRLLLVLPLERLPPPSPKNPMGAPLDRMQSACCSMTPGL